MKVIANVDTVSIVSNITMDTFNKVKTYAPEALQLRNKHGNIVFAIGIDSIGSMTNRGIAFSNTTADGKLFGTVTHPEMAHMDAATKKAFLKDFYGMKITNLKLIEQQVAEAMGGVEKTLNSLDEDIIVNEI